MTTTFPRKRHTKNRKRSTQGYKLPFNSNKIAWLLLALLLLVVLTMKTFNW
jgi:hypothetical protein